MRLSMFLYRFSMATHPTDGELQPRVCEVRRYEIVDVSL